jgi:prepilin-type N-terminal cleavage/methylation domain-containing protein
MTQPATKGFTLIELLVVISIIGLLAGIVSASLAGTRAKARNVQIVDTAHAYHGALDLFYSTNGYYPDPGGQDGQPYSDSKCIGTYTTTGSCTGEVSDTVNTALSTYLPSLPSMEDIPFSDGGPLQGPSYFCSNRTEMGKCSEVNLEWLIEPTTDACSEGATREPILNIVYEDGSSYTAYACFLTLN